MSSSKNNELPIPPKINLGPRKSAASALPVFSLLPPSVFTEFRDPVELSRATSQPSTPMEDSPATTPLPPENKELGLEQPTLERGKSASEEPRSLLELLTFNHAKQSSHNFFDADDFDFGGVDCTSNEELVPEFEETPEVRFLQKAKRKFEDKMDHNLQSHFFSHSHFETVSPPQFKPKKIEEKLINNQYKSSSHSPTFMPPPAPPKSIKRKRNNEGASLGAGDVGSDSQTASAKKHKPLKSVKSRLKKHSDKSLGVGQKK